MSKCYVRMKLQDGELIWDVKSQDGNPDLNDPDLGMGILPISGSVEKCDAEAPAGIEWSDWEIFVFTRKS